MHHGRGWKEILFPILSFNKHTRKTANSRARRPVHHRHRTGDIRRPPLDGVEQRAKMFRMPDIVMAEVGNVSAARQTQPVVIRATLAPDPPGKIPPLDARVTKGSNDLFG